MLEMPDFADSKFLGHDCRMNRFALIRDALEESGWSAHPIDLASDCWWAKEIWKLRSLWSPRDLTIYVVFLIDPVFEGDWNRVPESEVWAVGITNQIPNDRFEVETNAISINRKFETKIEEISTMASSFRTPG